MEMEPVPGYQFANWERGYGDFHMKADLSTLRRATWLDRTAMVTCDLLDASRMARRTGAALHPPPSTGTRRTLGYQPFAGTELEYYIFNNSYRQAAAAKYHGLEAAGWYLEDYHVLQGTREEKLNGAVRRHLAQSGIPVECSKGEWGKGQHELNVRFADALTMADRHAVFKQCFKEVADSLGMSVTFMAKPTPRRPAPAATCISASGRTAETPWPERARLGPVLC